MSSKRDIEAPICLADIFASPGDEDDTEDAFNQQYEVSNIKMAEKTIKVRQFAWHRANGNKVWPGTFNLAEYIDQHMERYKSGNILELGAATGALSVYLSSDPHNYQLCTSDIDDGGDVEDNIRYNFELNGMKAPLHIPHTWGEGWPSSVTAHSSSPKSDSDQVNVQTEAETIEVPRFKFIIASDILLYVR
jgi:predicted nicotinamide N-methyase